jgi:aminoglycoside 6'-N-acetyltransferase
MTSQFSASPYQFRPMSADDLPLLRGWLATPHVAAWWGDADEQFNLVSGDLDEAAMDQFIVVTQQHPFAYLQCYDPAAWPEGGLGAHPEGTRGIDQFIGEAGMVNRGHGSAFIRAFTDDLFGAGTPRIVTDPDPGNARAIRAYERAGFVKDKLVDTSDGIALLMVRNAGTP